MESAGVQLQRRMKHLPSPSRPSPSESSVRPPEYSSLLAVLLQASVQGQIAARQHKLCSVQEVVNSLNFVLQLIMAIRTEINGLVLSVLTQYLFHSRPRSSVSRLEVNTSTSRE